MGQETNTVDQVLKTPFPSYHRPLELARALNRSEGGTERSKALALLDGLRKQYPHVLAVGQEFVLALIESNEHDRAELALKALEHTFANLDEETLCRWGRLFKDRGDDYLDLPGAVSNRFAPNRAMALEFYRKSLDKYSQAYRIRSGYYPGINKATLLLMVGSLKAQEAGSPTGSAEELLISEDLAQATRESGVLGSGPPRRRDDLAPRHGRGGVPPAPGVGASRRPLSRGAGCQEPQPPRTRVDAPAGRADPRGVPRPGRRSGPAAVRRSGRVLRAGAGPPAGADRWRRRRAAHFNHGLRAEAT